MSLIERSADSDYRLKVNTIVTAANADDIPDMVGTLAPHASRIDRWSLDQFIPLNRGKGNRSKYTISDEEFLDVVGKVKEAAAGKFSEGVFGGGLKSTKEGTVMMFGPQGIPYVTIGDEKRYVPGNIRTRPLTELVEGAQRLELDVSAMNSKRYAEPYYSGSRREPIPIYVKK